MRIELTSEALEYGEVVRRALDGAADPDAVLAGLGVWDLDVRAGEDELEAAAAACRSAGWWAVPLDVAGRLAGPPAADPIAVTLATWTLLGLLDRAVAVTAAYVKARHQFGQPLASFQGVQFPLADAEVERAGVEVLAKYALWSAQTGRPEALEDALAARLAALEASEVVFRTAHQLHGAIGFCDETDLSWVSRRSQQLRRGDHGLAVTRRALLDRVDGRGLTGLFG